MHRRVSGSHRDGTSGGLAAITALTGLLAGCGGTSPPAAKPVPGAPPAIAHPGSAFAARVTLTGLDCLPPAQQLSTTPPPPETATMTCERTLENIGAVVVRSARELASYQARAAIDFDRYVVVVPFGSSAPLTVVPAVAQADAAQDVVTVNLDSPCPVQCGGTRNPAVESCDAAHEHDAYLAPRPARELHITRTSHPWCNPAQP